MNAVLLAIIGFVSFFLGYRFYSKFLAKQIYRLRPEPITPAYECEDGVDYVPTPPILLFCWVIILPL